MSSGESDLSAVSNFVVVIPAAGVGKRFGGSLAKQYQKIDGRMVLDITLDIFLSAASFEKIVLVVSPDDEEFKQLEAIANEKLIIIDGGEHRHASVNNALRYLYDSGLPDDTAILVHDAVRPCLPSSDLEQLIESYHDDKTACFLAEPMADSLKRIDLEQRVIESVSRDNLVRAQTPQMCRFIDLKNALSKVTKAGIDVTDEVSALTDCDIEVRAVLSKQPNLKITLPSDLELARQILASQSKS